MSLVLHVDGDRWRGHLRATVEARPGLVPVIKGNGYGFGNGRLARRAQWLAEGPGCDTIAVGTYAEIDDVAQRFAGDVVVLSPWRPWGEAVERISDDRVIHTVGRLSDLEALVEAPGRPRVILERLTSMKRHGFTARGLREAMTAAGRGVRVDGVSVHLPLDRPGNAKPRGGGGSSSMAKPEGSAATGSNLDEAAELMVDIVAAGLGSQGCAPVVWVSHLGAADLDRLAAQYPDFTFRPRVGTDLWLGDPTALRVTARVLDSHPVERGERFGYRRRAVPRTGTLLIVAGGTSHGIGLESPTGAGGVRARAVTVARGGLDAVGLVRSPYTVAGRARYFAEPPHMQASMLFLPSGVDVPAVGDEVDVRVRLTATTVDSVEVR